MAPKARKTPNKPRKNIGILFGGRSGEHEVSLESARNILQLIDTDQYNIHPIGISPAGQLESAKKSMSMLPGFNWEKVLHGRQPVEPSCLLSYFSPGPNTSNRRNEPALDVVFPVLHGPYGEDGTIQGLLEISNIPFVGSGVLGSALGMDKWLAKQLMKTAGLQVVETLMVERHDWYSASSAVLRKIKKMIGLPCFVKPVRLGSSIGISKVSAPGDTLAKAIDLACQYDYRILVERAVDAQELEVSVLGNTHPIASVVGEIVPGGEFYDYQSKYLDSKTQANIPAQIPNAIAAKARRMAVKAFQVLDCSGLARVDFFLERKTKILFLSEINTMPGFTCSSMYSKLWQASGLSGRELVNRLIALAFEWKELTKRRIYE
jgi:D-alanine-D-alanine ligase